MKSIRHYLLPTVCAWSVIAVSAAGCASTTDSEEDESSSSQELNGKPYDPVKGNAIANRAQALWGNGRSRDLCLAGVGDSLDSSGVVSPAFPRLPSAVDFDNWSKNNPNELARRGFERQSLDINHMPRGTIITWRPGQCGYSSQYGHIEIVTDNNSSRACSDFCQSIRKNCGAPGMIVPVGNGTGGGGGGVVNGGGGGGGGNAGTPGCEVQADKKLHCANSPNVAIHQKPTNGSPVVNTLRTTNSWFDCWFPGDMHSGGNTTWYWTMGDDNGNKGFVPASALQTSSAFDANPSASGLIKCGD